MLKYWLEEPISLLQHLFLSQFCIHCRCNQLLYEAATVFVLERTKASFSLLDTPPVAVSVFTTLLQLRSFRIHNMPRSSVIASSNPCDMVVVFCIETTPYFLIESCPVTVHIYCNQPNTKHRSFCIHSIICRELAYSRVVFMLEYWLEEPISLLQ